jgi:hypothetical protein
MGGEGHGARSGPGGEDADAACGPVEQLVKIINQERMKALLG